MRKTIYKSVQWLLFLFLLLSPKSRLLVHPTSNRFNCRGKKRACEYVTSCSSCHAAASVACLFFLAFPFDKPSSVVVFVNRSIILCNRKFFVVCFCGGSEVPVAADEGEEEIAVLEQRLVGSLSREKDKKQKNLTIHRLMPLYLSWEILLLPLVWSSDLSQKRCCVVRSRSRNALDAFANKSCPINVNNNKTRERGAALHPQIEGGEGGWLTRGSRIYFPVEE